MTRTTLEQRFDVFNAAYFGGRLPRYRVRVVQRVPT